MARFNIFITLVSAMFALLLCFQLALSLLANASRAPLVDRTYTNSTAANSTTNDTANTTSADNSTNYLIGVGKGDITGPVVEIGFMGYAYLSQVGTGLRQRLYTRAFIVGNPSNESERVVYLIMDTQSGDTAVRNGIIEGLAALGSEYSVYTKNNVAVVGTHSHSGPGAWLNYFLPQVTTLGFYKPSYNAIVEGSLLAIQRAHESLTNGTVSVGVTTLVNGAINRSLYAYLNNPADERAMYEYDTDKNMTLLKFTRSSDGKAIGILNWYAVHGTSLFENNTLVTGDNKGVAAWMFEQYALTDDTMADGFVAGFSQANVGDTTPNVDGAYCQSGADIGQMCRFNDSTCNGETEGCQGRGPLWQINDNGTQSCHEIGRRQYAAALSLYQSSDFTPISGSVVTGFHTFQDMENYTFISPLDPSRGELTACSAALGYSFAAGTSDGAGDFDFTEGENSSSTTGAVDNPLWVIVRDLIHTPSAAQVACQDPKPILFDAGSTYVPYEWAPNIIDVQLLRIGNFIMIISPGEATTMSGRRWRSQIASAAQSNLSISNPVVVLGAPANTYSHYIATEEEYQIQRYEGASTLHGPHSLEAHINLTLTYLPLLKSAADAATIPDGPEPPINTNISLNFNTDVVYDTPIIGYSYGDTLSNPSTSITYSAGSLPRPSTVFVAADPRNDLRLEETYAAVEYQSSDGTWTTVRNDSDWTLVFRWTRVDTLLGTSTVNITWEVDQESSLDAGTYRMMYYGNAKNILGTISAIEGTGGTFTVG